jgi:hypothetical protein
MQVIGFIKFSRLNNGGSATIQNGAGSPPLLPCLQASPPIGRIIAKEFPGFIVSGIYDFFLVALCNSNRLSAILA